MNNSRHPTEMLMNHTQNLLLKTEWLNAYMTAFHMYYLPGGDALGSLPREDLKNQLIDQLKEVVKKAKDLELFWEEYLDEADEEK